MRAEKWSFTTGAKPFTVTVEEREPGGTIYIRMWDRTARDGAGNWVRRSLGHRDKKKAKAYAIEEAAKLAKGEASTGEAKVTLAQVFSLYERHKTPHKSAGQRLADKQRVDMWTRVLGGSMDPHAITPEQWSGFMHARRMGAIDARGNIVDEKKRKPLRARTVEADCQWLRFAFNWAAEWRLPSGKFLMRSNPIRGSLFDVPSEKNPVQPVATAEFFGTIREAAERHRMEVRTDKTPGAERPKVPSYMPELLDIAHDTARRIAAICSLRYSDITLEATKTAPHGAIRWPGDFDKEGREWKAPITPRVRAALLRVLKARPGVGTGFIFPAPGDPSQALEKRLANR